MYYQTARLHRPQEGSRAPILLRAAAAAIIPGLLDFLLLAAWLFALCLFSYGAATFPLRAIEFAVGAKVAEVKPGLGPYVKMQALAVLGQALFTPALCYVTAGLVYKGGQFTDPGAFSGSVYFWVSLWLVGLLLPVQFHYSLNRRLYSADAEQTVRPSWLAWLWGVNSLLSATLMWLPLWMGWVTLAPMW